MERGDPPSQHEGRNDSSPPASLLCPPGEAMPRAEVFLSHASADEEMSGLLASAAATRVYWTTHWSEESRRRSRQAMVDVFISYAHQDLDFVKDLAVRLQAARLS